MTKRTTLFSWNRRANELMDTSMNKRNNCKYTTERYLETCITNNLFLRGWIRHRPFWFCLFDQFCVVLSAHFAGKCNLFLLRRGLTSQGRHKPFGLRRRRFAAVCFWDLKSDMSYAPPCWISYFVQIQGEVRRRVNHFRRKNKRIFKRFQSKQYSLK